MTTPVSPIRLSQEFVVEAAAVMAHAAVDDPLFVHILPDPSQRERKVALLMQTNVRIGLAHGEVWTTPQITGVACWFPPVHAAVSQEDREAAGFSEVRAAWDETAVSRFHDVGADVGEVEASIAVQPHWYLQWLCVEPSAQGQGIGSNLVRHITTRADAEGVACHLLNFVPRNVPIYEHLGFRDIREAVLPRTGLRLWLMARPPDL